MHLKPRNFHAIKYVYDMYDFDALPHWGFMISRSASEQSLCFDTIALISLSIESLLGIINTPIDMHYIAKFLSKI